MIGLFRFVDRGNLERRGAGNVPAPGPIRAWRCAELDRSIDCMWNLEWICSAPGCHRTVLMAPIPRLPALIHALPTPYPRPINAPASLLTLSRPPCACAVAYRQLHHGPSKFTSRDSISPPFASSISRQTERRDAGSRKDINLTLPSFHRPDTELSAAHQRHGALALDEAAAARRVPAQDRAAVRFSVQGSFLRSSPWSLVRETPC